MRDGSLWRCRCGRYESSPISERCPGCRLRGERYPVPSVDPV